MPAKTDRVQASGRRTPDRAAVKNTWPTASAGSARVAAVLVWW